LQPPESENLSKAVYVYWGEKGWKGAGFSKLGMAVWHHETVFMVGDNSAVLFSHLWIGGILVARGDGNCRTLLPLSWNH